MNGFRTKNKQYFENIEHAAAHIHSNLFRPPYGKIKKSQGRRKLLKDGYQIIMWSVLSGDFDTSVSPEKCYLNVVRYASEGSIVVMHDSKKAKEKIYDSLPKILNYFLSEVIVLIELLRGTVERDRLRCWHLAHPFGAISFHHLYKS